RIIRGQIALAQHVSEGAGQSAAGHCTETFAVVEFEAALRDAAEAVRLLQDCVEYRREVTWRRVDDLQNFSGRCLLFESYTRFGDQPHVLDRDDRLRGKVLQQPDLLVGERPDFAPV